MCLCCICEHAASHTYIYPSREAKRWLSCPCPGDPLSRKWEQAPVVSGPGCGPGPVEGNGTRSGVSVGLLPLHPHGALTCPGPWVVPPAAAHCCCPAWPVCPRACPAPPAAHSSCGGPRGIRGHPALGAERGHVREAPWGPPAERDTCRFSCDTVDSAFCSGP